MASETTLTSKKIDYWTKVISIIMIVGKFQGGEMPVRGDIPWFPPPLNKSLEMGVMDSIYIIYNLHVQEASKYFVLELSEI